MRTGVKEAQRLRSLFKPLQSGKRDATTLATELPPKFVDAELAILPFPLQDTKGDQTAGDVMDLRPLCTRLTAREAELILTNANQFLDLGTSTIQLPHLHGRQRQAIGGVVLFAVSDNQHFEAATQPADLGPVGMPPMMPNCLSIEPAILLESTDKVPPLVTNAFQQRFGRIPRIKQDVRRPTAQVITGRAEQLQRQSILRKTAFVPQTYSQRDA